MADDADALPLPLDLNDDRLEALDDVLVGLPGGVPGGGGVMHGGDG